MSATPPLRRMRLAYALVIGPAMLVAAEAGPGAAEETAVARFVVSDTVVQPDLPRFAVVMTGLGNGAAMLGEGSGFEPVVMRDMFLATERSEDRVIAPPHVISDFHSRPEGMLDGAEVEVLRMIDGRLRQVRLDRVAEGGHAASGWRPALNGGRIVPGHMRSFAFYWKPWERPGAEYHFTVRAVDAEGRLSKRATPVSAWSPRRIRRVSVDQGDFPRGERNVTAPSALPPPSGLAVAAGADGAAILSWRPVQGAQGYAVEVSDTPPERHRGFALHLEGGADGARIRPGDLVILRKRLEAFSREALMTRWNWNAPPGERKVLPDPMPGFGDDEGDWSFRLRRHAQDTPVEDAGETYLQIDLEGREIRIGRGEASGTAQVFYPVLEPGRTYRIEAWMRARGPARARFIAPDPERESHSRFFRLDGTWRRYAFRFTPRTLYEGRRIGLARLALSGRGAVDVDNLRVMADDAPFLGLTATEASRLREGAVSVVRTHALIKTDTSTYDLAQLTNPGGAINGADSGNTLHQNLTAFVEAGVEPWLQIEPHLTEAEWLGLVEYLAAPFDPATDSAEAKPWAAKRVAQGRAAPWTDAFETIRFELGNETWNRIFDPWIFADMPDAGTGRKAGRGVVYGAFQERVLEIMRRSPYWPALGSKLRTVIGGFGAIPAYGAAAAAASPSTDVLTIGAYIGGWETKSDPLEEIEEDYAWILTHWLQTGRPRSIPHVEAAARIARQRGRPLAIGVYEAGPGYLLGGSRAGRLDAAAAATQERMMKSLAAGTATIDTFLGRAMLGFRTQAFFTLGDGPRWTSHARPHLGGAPFPSWMLLALFNREAHGDLLAVDTLETPRADLAKGRLREGIADAPMVAAYAIGDARRLVLFVLSRATTNSGPAGAGTRVMVELPERDYASIRRFAPSDDYRAHGLDGARVTMIETRLDPASVDGRLEITRLAPGETQVFVLERQ